MKICIIANFYPPYFFGGERAYQREAEGLVERGHKVTVITSSPDNNSYHEDLNMVQVYRFRPLNIYPPYQAEHKPLLLKPLFHGIDFWNIHSYREIKNILKKINPDVVYIHNFKGLSLSVFGSVKRLGLPSVFCVNDFSLICPKADLLRASGQICSRPLPICHIYANVHRNIFGRNKPDLVVSPALFTLDKLKNAGFFKEVQTKREVIGVDHCKNRSEKYYNITNILYVGNVSKHKGVHILIQAFTKIKSQSVRLHIVGKGKYLDETERLCEGDSRIKIYGFVSDEILGGLRQESNIAVVPSIWYDMAQGAICESFSYGTPVIGSRIGGIPEYIDEGYNGLLFEPGNSEELKIILERLANNPQELKRLEEGALESGTRYNTEQHIDRLEIIFSDLIKKRMNI